MPIRCGHVSRWCVGVVAAGAGIAGSWSQGTTASAAGGSRRVLLTTVDSTITPVIAAHLDDGIDRAAGEGFEAYVIRLDTPGGLDTSMRDIVQDVLASEVPVVVHISPQGARGASAGAIITFAAHVAAMAPGTAIGAATPVSGGTGDDLEDKIVNDAIAYAVALAELRGRSVEFAEDAVRDGRSISATAALELGVVDVMASSTDELLAAIDGRTVQVGPAAREVVLHTTGAQVVEHDMGVLRSIQQLLADPNIAFLLLSLGTLALLYEFASPGIGVGAALGVTLLVLALFGLAVVPLRLAGVLFLLLAAALFAAEIAAPGIGIAAAGGALALALSGLFLIDEAPGMEVSLAVVLPTAIVVGGFVVIAGRFAVRARAAPASTTGLGPALGQQAVVRLGGRGEAQIFVAGAWWRVRSAEPAVALTDGDAVEVVDADGLTLLVRPTDAPHTISTRPPPGGPP